MYFTWEGSSAVVTESWVPPVTHWGGRCRDRRVSIPLGEHPHPSACFFFCTPYTTLGHGLKCPAELSVLDLGAVSGSPAGVSKDTTVFLPMGASSWSNLIFLGLGGSHGCRLAPTDLFSPSHVSGIAQASLEVWHRRMLAGEAGLFSSSLKLPLQIRPQTCLIPRSCPGPLSSLQHIPFPSPEMLEPLCQIENMPLHAWLALRK